MTETQSGIGVHGEDVPALLDRWARLGLLSPEQVEQILRAEGISAAGAVPAVRPAAPVPEPRPTPPSVEAERGHGRLAVEALGYLGGVLALAAGLLLVQLVWEDLSTAARLAIPLVASALLLLAGALVPTTSRDAEGMLRLRSVLWLLAVAAWGATFGVLGDQVLEADAEDTMLLVGLGALGLALPLYYATHSAAQQFAVFGSAVTTVIAIGTRPDWEEPTFVGLAGWLLALAWFVAAERKLVSPPLVGRYLGALGAVFFVLLMAGTLAGQLIALATIAALFVWAVRVDSVGLLAVAAYGTLQAVPSMVNYFFPDNARVVIPLGLLAAGGVLVGTAVLISRRRTRRQSAAESDQHARR
jgi:hypothetical protein